MPETESEPAQPRGPLRNYWALDPEILFLNHGSFGACPIAVLDHQRELREQMEREPVRFFDREYPALLHHARQRLALFLGAEPSSLAFVPNATTGVNTVLRSLNFSSGDEILVTEHAYGACRNAVEFAAERAGARLRIAPTPFPTASDRELEVALFEGVTAHTRLVLLDHVTSPSGLVYPVEKIVSALNARGIDTLVDGAHAPGMLPLNLKDLDAAYYVGNLHKWVCAPKGAAFLCVRADRQAQIRPLSISHGATLPAGEISRFQLEFDWTGTDDPTPWLCVPSALDVLGGLVDGGWASIIAMNHAKAVEARKELCSALDIPIPCPSEMLGSLAAVPLPARFGGYAPTLEGARSLQDRLLFEHKVEVPIIYWPTQPTLLLRLSAQIYNSMDEYRALSAILRKIGAR
jgi:isopenicillin-N epimerase